MIDTAAAPAALSRTGAARWAAWGYALLAAAVLGHFLLGLPIQVSDSFGNMLKLSSSWSELFYEEFNQRAFLRPMLWAELKLVYDLSGGNYFAWFRGTHVVQVFALIALYLVLVRPRTWTDAAILPLGLAVLIGVHTFAGTVREAFPINTHMTILLCCFAAAALALARHRWWNDVLAVLLFVAAALTVETGLLVWVVFIGAALTGARGVSKAGIAALVVLMGGYFYLRFGPLAVGSPDLMERSSGFGFRILEPAELMDRFGSNPLPFYAYNVAAQALSVLFTEPSAGVFRVVDAVRSGEVRPIMVVQVASSMLLTTLLGVFVWIRRRQWLSWQLDRDDRLVMLFVMVLAANATISFPYTKDVIMSPAGAFLGVAAFAAARGVAHDWMRRAAAPAVAVAIAAAGVLGVSWAIRVEALHGLLREAAVSERLDWANIDSSVEDGRVLLPDDRSRALLRTLQHDALVANPTPPPLDLPLARRMRGDD